jgi:hypothetical protein
MPPAIMPVLEPLASSALPLKRYTALAPFAVAVAVYIALASESPTLKSYMETSSMTPVKKLSTKPIV